MSIFSGLEKIVRTHCPLSSFTWYGLGGPADYFVMPETVEQLTEVMRRCEENALPLRVLGHGSNLLVRDEGVPGVVLRLDQPRFAQVEYAGSRVTAGAGAALSRLVLDCVRKGLAGLEPLTGIPGSVGGAVKMNAGGNFGDIGASVERVQLMDTHGRVFERVKPDLSFDYRRVNLTAPVILSATLQLSEAEPDTILRTVKEIWIYKKNTQPLNMRNAGCVFKNPRQLSAGALIDRAGLKGAQVGGAKVSEKHANFILAEAGCTSRDVLELIDTIRSRVRDSFGIELELELEIW